MKNNNQKVITNKTVLDNQQAKVTGVVAKKFMANVFLWMFIGLGVSTIFAILASSNSGLMDILYIQTSGRMILSDFGKCILFAPFVFVMVMSFAFKYLSAPLLTLFFLLCTATMGMNLSVILLLFTSSSVYGCFASASAMFGIMAIMGYTTEKDLTSFGNLLMMGLLGILIAVTINFFLGSSQIDYLISIIGVAVFTGLTAYDVQAEKRIGAGIEYEGTSADDTKKQAVRGALRLYLDFVNLLVSLLRLFGGKK